MSEYKVIKAFIDLKDNNRLYVTGDDYVGSTAKARVAELSTKKNKRGEPLIESVKKAEPKAEKDD
ncbi:hypothetical protein [Dolosicoccus paucivorans]